MASEQAAPCRHAGTAPDHIVDQVAAVIRALANDADYLSRRGLSIEEYAGALPAAIERMRGSTAASTSNRRDFLGRIFDAMLSRGLISKLESPRYGDDTVYRLHVAGFGDVAVIQKGWSSWASGTRSRIRGKATGRAHWNTSPSGRIRFGGAYALPLSRSGPADYCRGQATHHHADVISALPIVSVARHHRLGSSVPDTPHR